MTKSALFLPNSLFSETSGETYWKSRGDYLCAKIILHQHLPLLMLISWKKTIWKFQWHDYADADSHVIISQTGLIEKSSVIGRVGLIMLSCGTGAWRVRTSMNRLSRELGVTCTVDVGLMSISFNCFDGKRLRFTVSQHRQYRVSIHLSCIEWNNS